MKYFLIYILGINLCSFYLFGSDKKRSRYHKWRISESTLLFSSILGGSIGGLIGMKFFRHKTKKWKFKILMPLILIIHIYILYSTYNIG